MTSVERPECPFDDDDPIGVVNMRSTSKRPPKFGKTKRVSHNHSHKNTNREQRKRKLEERSAEDESESITKPKKYNTKRKRKIIVSSANLSQYVKDNCVNYISGGCVWNYLCPVQHYRCPYFENVMLSVLPSNIAAEYEKCKWPTIEERYRFWADDFSIACNQCNSVNIKVQLAKATASLFKDLDLSLRPSQNDILVFYCQDCKNQWIPRYEQVIFEATLPD